MKTRYHLEALLPDTPDRLALFAFINLGLIESMSHGIVSASEAVEQLYFAANCTYVRSKLKDKGADRIMGHGSQLPDLFDALPPDRAQREYLHKLAAMRLLCLKILDGRRQVA